MPLCGYVRLSPALVISQFKYASFYFQIFYGEIQDIMQKNTLYQVRAMAILVLTDKEYFNFRLSALLVIGHFNHINNSTREFFLQFHVL